MHTHVSSFITVLSLCVWGESPYILYADGEISLEVVKVLCQLVAMVIVGEQALKKRQKLKETKKNKTKDVRKVKVAEDEEEEGRT